MKLTISIALVAATCVLASCKNPSPPLSVAFHAKAETRIDPSGLITLIDDDTEEVATTMIDNIKATGMQPINGHLKVDKITCDDPEAGHATCKLVIGNTTKTLTGPDGTAMVELLDEIGGFEGAETGVVNVDCRTLGAPRCTMRAAVSFKVSGENGPCGDHESVRSKCGKGLACVLPITGGSIGVCKKGCMTDSDCTNGTLCCNTGGAALSRPRQCIKPQGKRCPLFP
jgi:hypothetical protein